MAYFKNMVPMVQGGLLMLKVKLLITGGTGTFGNAVLKRFLDTDIKEIRLQPR